MVTGVIDLLIADATIQGIVGLNSDGDKYKVYPVIAPQKEKYPYIIVRQVSKIRIGKGCPYSGGVEVTSVHKSYDEVVECDDAVISLLDGNGDIVLTSGGLDGWVQADGDGLYTRISTFEGSEI